jgi:AraC-like DNA-binding protein
MKTRRYAKSLYLRLLFTYLPMVVVAVFLITLLLTYTTGNYMTKAMDELYATTIDSTADVLDSKLSGVINTLFQLACNRKINDLRTVPEPYSVEDLYMIADIVDELSTAAVCDDMIEKIYIYNPRKDYILTGKAKFGIRYFFGDCYPEQEPHEIIDRITGTGQRGFFSVPRGDSLTLTLVMSTPLISMNPELYLCAILNEQQLKSPAVITLEENENLIFLNDKKEIVYNYNPGFDGGQLSDDIDEIVARTGALAYPTVSARTGLTYLYMTQSSFVRDHLLRVTLYALLIGSATIVAVVILVIVASRRISMPVASLVKFFRSRDKEPAPVGDLDLIRDKVFELYRSQDEMTRRMESVNAAALEWVLGRLFSRTSVAARQAETMREMNLSFARPHMIACIFKILRYPSLQKRYTESAFAELKEKLTTLIKTQLQPSADTYIVHRESLLIVSVNYSGNPRSFREALQEQLYGLQNIFKSSLALDVHAVVGDLVEPDGNDTAAQLDALYRSFLSAERCLGLLFFMREPVIILDAPEKLASADRIYRFPEESEQTLMNHLFAGRSQEAVSAMRQIIEYNRACDYANMRQLLSELLSVAVKTLLKSNANLEDVLKPRSSLIAELEACDTLYDTLDYIDGVYRQVGEYFRSLSMKWPMTKADVMRFIEDNYVYNIGISDAAEHFGLSVGYFSRVFKQMMNETFLEYLNSFRVGKAENMILENRIPLKDIAEKAGFASYKSFTRAFRKVTLSTPFEYKQKMLGTECVANEE